MTTPPADFTDSELKLINQALAERYGHPVPIQLADTEVQLDAEGAPLTDCPTVYWQARGAQFVIIKMGLSRYGAQFFYNEASQFGTGKPLYDNLGDCVITLLQVQSDHERQMKGIRSGATAADIKDDDYDGPLVI